MIQYKILGYAPDADPTTPGVVTDCTMMEPSLRGMKAAPSVSNLGLVALATAAQGAALVTALDGTKRLLVGTQTGLFEAGSSWTDVTRLTALTTPGAASGTGSGTGGTLAAATYYVKVVALDGDGNMTAAGPEDAGVATTGTTSSIAYTWSAVADAASYRVYYGTASDGQDKYYTSATNSYSLTEDAGTAGTPPSAADTVDYTSGADDRWRFAQFGSVTLACNGVDAAQASTSGAFADLAAMPKAKLVETAAGFVVVANITDAAYQYSDGWWCSALYDYTDWTPAISTQSARARLIDTPGPINALRALGDDLVAFKERSMYRGRYVGPDTIWSWEPLPGSVGAFSQASVVSDGSALYWWGGDNFYRFDGSRQEPIGGEVKDWFASNASRSYMYKMQGAYDRESSLIRWYFVSGSDTEPATCLVYNVITRKWGRADRAIECAVEYVTSTLTYDGAGILAAVTYDSTDWPQSFDSLFWTSSAQTPAVVNSAHTLQSLTGVSGASSLTTGDFGDDSRYCLLKRVRVRYADDPDTASMTNYSRRNSGTTLSTHDTVSEDDGKFDVLWSDRWHRLRFNWTGNVEVTGFMADLQPEGER